MEYTTLDKISENLDSKRKPITSSDRVEGKIPYYGASGIVDYVKDYIFDESLLLVSEDGANLLARSTPIAFSVTGKTWINNHAHVLRFSNENLQKFVEIYLNSISLESYVTGSAQPKLNQKMLNGIPIPVVDDSQIEIIVNSVENLKSIIELRKQELACLDELIKARFVEMFGDVIHNSKKWQVCLFAEITSSRLGKMLDAKQQTGRNSYPYLANFNVQWFRFNLENLNKMDFDEKDRAEFELREGDLLVCEGGEIGRCAVWHNELQPCFFQKALHRVRCNHQIILPDYLAWWFRYNCDYGGFSALAGAKATIAHLPGAKLKQLQVAVPPMELQEQFAVFVAQTDKSKVAVQKALDEAQLLFDSLMQEYFG